MDIPATPDLLLLKLGFPQYKHLFHDVNVHQILSMGTEELALRGVPPGPRVKMIQELKKLAEHSSASRLTTKIAAPAGNTPKMQRPKTPASVVAGPASTSNPAGPPEPASSEITPTSVSSLRNSFMQPSTQKPTSAGGSLIDHNTGVNHRATGPARVSAGRYSTMGPASNPLPGAPKERPNMIVLPPPSPSPNNPSLATKKEETSTNININTPAHTFVQNLNNTTKKTEVLSKNELSKPNEKPRVSAVVQESAPVNPPTVSITVSNTSQSTSVESTSSSFTKATTGSPLSSLTMSSTASLPATSSNSTTILDATPASVNSLASNSATSTAASAATTTTASSASVTSYIVPKPSALKATNTTPGVTPNKVAITPIDVSAVRRDEPQGRSLTARAKGALRPILITSETPRAARSGTPKKVSFHPETLDTGYSLNRVRRNRKKGVDEFFEQIGLHDYIGQFADMDYESIFFMTKLDLLKRGLPLAIRTKLLNEIERVRIERQNKKSGSATAPTMSVAERMKKLKIDAYPKEALKKQIEEEEEEEEFSILSEDTVPSRSIGSKEDSDDTDFAILNDDDDDTDSRKNSSKSVKEKYQRLTTEPRKRTPDSSNTASISTSASDNGAATTHDEEGEEDFAILDDDYESPGGTKSTYDEDLPILDDSEEEKKEKETNGGDGKDHRLQNMLEELGYGNHVGGFDKISYDDLLSYDRETIMKLPLPVGVKLKVFNELQKRK